LRWRKTASLPFFAFKFLFHKNLGNLFTPASLPARLHRQTASGPWLGLMTKPRPFGGRRNRCQAPFLNAFNNEYIFYREKAGIRIYFCIWNVMCHLA
jgi:hypothetical protein